MITVITAVHSSRADYLPDAYRSLETQQLPAGWRWEWLVQCDGSDSTSQDTVRSLLPDDERALFSASRRGGPGVARTMALARATGELVKVLDADDRLAPGVLARDIEACSGDGIAWSTSRDPDEPAIRRDLITARAVAVHSLIDAR